MLNILQDHSVYRSRCTDSVTTIVEYYLQLYERYIIEYLNGEKYHENDFQRGVFILHNVFMTILTNTQNAEVAYKIGNIAILYYIEFINQISKNTPLSEIKSYSFLFENDISDNTTNITYNDVVTFVYSKTLSNIINNLVKTTMTPNLIISDYFFRINQILLSNSNINEYHKIAKCIRICIKIQFTVQQLQSLLIMIEYVNSECIPLEKILLQINVFSKYIARNNFTITPFDAMKKVTNTNFKYYVKGSSPYIFVKWFFK